jgi:glycosyltransferase involved in cell wall biosynthesis
MKIGFDAKRIFHNRTGLGNYSRDLVRILSHYHPENKYVLYNPKKRNAIAFNFDHEATVEALPSSGFCKFFYNLWRQFFISSDLLKDNIQIFHGLSGEIPCGLKRKGIKTVVSVHDLIFLRYPQFYTFFDRYIHKIKAQYSVRNADVVVAVSEQTKYDIIEFFDIQPEKIEVVYQGCQDVFKQTFSEEDKAAVLQKFNLPKHFILNVGTIEERKNILVGVKAIQDLDTHLVIVGSETNYTQRVKEYIAANNLGSKVFFLKGVSNEELAMLYQLAQLFIYPSLFEGFGIPIIEALFSRTPVVTSKGGCFGEAGGPSTIYVDASNIDEVKQAIIQVLSDDALRTKMIHNGYQYAQRFTPEYIGSSFVSIYWHCLNS